MDAQAILDWLGSAEAVLVVLALFWLIIAIFVYYALASSPFPPGIRLVFSLVVPTLAIIGGRNTLAGHDLVDLVLPSYVALGVSLLLLLVAIVRRGAKRRFWNEDE